MKTRIELLAGLLDEDDDEQELKYSLVEDYEKQFEEDKKIISENVKVIEDNDIRFNRMVGIEQEEENVILNENKFVAPQGEYTIAHGHGLGPGFAGFQASPEIYDPYKGLGTLTNKWMLGETSFVEEEEIISPKQSPNQEDMDLLSFDALDALEDLSAGSDLIIRQNGSVRDDLLDRQMAVLSPEGGFKITEKGIDYLNHVMEGVEMVREAYEGGVPGDVWFYDQTGNIDGGYVRFREDPYNERPMRAHHDQFAKPGGWSFYAADHTNQKIEAQKNDVLDFKEEESIKDYLQKFFDKNDVNKK